MTNFVSDHAPGGVVHAPNGFSMSAIYYDPYDFAIDVDPYWPRAEQAHTNTVRGWEKLPVLVP